MTTGRCLYHNVPQGIEPQSMEESRQARVPSMIRERFDALMLGDSPDIKDAIGEQAYYAVCIAQFGENINKAQEQLSMYLTDLEDTPTTYRRSTDEISVQLKKIGKHFWRNNGVDENTVDRLLAGLETFHAYVKRAVLNSQPDEKGIRSFPYQKAIELASTHIGRANHMATNPDIQGWETIFFDSSIDTSKQFLGIPISNRPVYRCPVLYSGKFRILIDFYFDILSRAWELSSDRPEYVNWGSDTIE